VHPLIISASEKDKASRSRHASGRWRTCPLDDPIGCRTLNALINRKPSINPSGETFLTDKETSNLSSLNR